MVQYYRKHRKSLNLLASFFLPLLIGGIGFVMRGIAPFGKMSLAAIDGYGQYFPMLREAERHFFSPHGYSFSGALGFSFSAESAYYTNSPLNVLLFLLPGQVQVWEMDLLILFRFGLMSCAMYRLLSSHYGEHPLPEFALSLAYAFSSYTLAFINQVMWMDALILLPLLVLQLRRIAENALTADRKAIRKHALLYTLLLFLLIRSCFYTAFMVCIFLCLFFLFIILNLRPFSGKQALRAFLFFSGCSVFSALLSLPALFPLLRALSHTAAIEKEAPDLWRFLHTPAEYLLNMLPGAKASLQYGAPNLYFGLFSLISLMLAISDRSISWLRKISAGLFLVFLLFSFNLAAGDYVWHGFHEPSQLPGRESFLFIFLLLYFAGAGIGLLKKPLHRRIFAFALTVEILANTLFSFFFVPCVSAVRVSEMDAVIESVREEITPDLQGGEFFRTELLDYRDNGGQLYGYPGISFYSSTMSREAYQFFLNFGVDIYAENVSTRFSSPESQPLLLDLFSVRYLLENDGTLIENPDALPLIFPCRGMITEKAAFFEELQTDKKTGDKITGFSRQNAFFRAISGTEEDVITSDGEILSENYEKFREALRAFGSCEIRSIREGLFFTEIQVHAEIKKEGILLAGIPFSDVFSVEIDGRKAGFHSECGYLTGIRISTGRHDIRIRLRG